MPKKVAVIGVHGVAHHDPGSTANAMADLLLSLPAEHPGEPRYFDSFTAQGVEIPLRPLAVWKTQERAPRTFIERLFAPLQEESTLLAESIRGQGGSRGFAGREFMRRTLEKYAGGADGDAYVTTRLEGKRGARVPGGAAEVHIFEVLWADLARPTNSLLSFLFALFQLLLHLASLSRIAVDTGTAENQGWTWRALQVAQRYAVRMLQIPLVFLNIILFIALLSCLPSVLPATRERIWVPTVLGLLLVLSLAYMVTAKREKPVGPRPWLWALQAVIPMGFAAGAVWLVVARSGALISRAGAAECWILAAALLYYVIRSYEDVRRGIVVVAWLLYAICFGLFLLYTYATPSSVTQATLWTVEWLLAALRFSWFLLIVFAFLALLFGSFAWRSIPRNSQERRARARAAVRTSRFALALPSVLFLLVTVIIWASLFSISSRGIKPSFFPQEELSLPPGGHWLTRVFLVPVPTLTRQELELRGKSDSEVASKAGTYATLDYLHDVLIWSVTEAFVLTLALTGIGFFLLLWWALPAALTERFPLRTATGPPRNSSNTVSTRLGSWISRGLDATSIVTFLFWCSIFLVPPLFVMPTHWIVRDPEHLPIVSAVRNVIANSSGSFVNLFVVTAAALLTGVVRYAKPVLGAVLDVDNYLRTSPAEATPRAKIVERYVSLLRYIAKYRDDEGRGYDSIVIVAHSLGTLISADLLRYLFSEGDPELIALGLGGPITQGAKPTISISFLSMGSPIRQLLNRFFPFLYDWVRNEPDNSLRPLPPPDFPTQTRVPSGLPDPGELGVRN